eukprot:scaffold1314_cov158-Amphora_coffeaeformis.AAC.4
MMCMLRGETQTHRKSTERQGSLASTMYGNKKRHKTDLGLAMDDEPIDHSRHDSPQGQLLVYGSVCVFRSVWLVVAVYGGGVNVIKEV